MNQEPLANWNGVEMPLEDVRVPALDRGFLFGDAIYEVVRVYRRKPFHFQDHMDRLARNLEKIRITTDVDRIAARSLETLHHSGVVDGTIYLQVTRGAARRTHRFPVPAVLPNELISVQAMEDPYPRERELGGQAILTEDLRWKRCDIKSVNLLPNCLGAEEAHIAGCIEAIFVTPEGVLVEGTRTSLFGVLNGAILTAPLAENLLPGITRRLILRLAGQAGIPVEEAPLHKNSLDALDELFITGTTMEVMPIVRVDKTIIGTGAPGPVVRALQAAYREEIQRECA